MKYINFPDEHSRLIVLSLYHFTQIQSKWPVFNDPSTNFPLPVFALYCTILVYLFHVSLCHVVHFSCYTFFTMQSFNVILSSCSTFLINWTFFMACTLFMVALLSCCTFLVLRIFHFAIFLLHISCVALSAFRFWTLICAIYDSKDIVQFKYQS